jgi:hypothetical protein
MGEGYDTTSNTASWSNGNTYVWLNRNPDYYYNTFYTTKKEKKKEFIDESEFKV